MMCFGSNGDDAAAADVARSRALDKQIRADEKRLAREVKLLLLGAGEAGKSTVLKQMKLLYAQGFSKSERLDWKRTIFRNIVEAFDLILEAMDRLDIAFEYEESKVAAAQVVVNVEPNAAEPLPPEYLQPLKQLWKDGGVRQAVARGNEFALQDNLVYFCDDLDRLWDRQYVPTDQDVLRCRLRTTGISETTFDMGPLKYRMFDLGGQRSERRKWIHCFQNVTGVLFLVAISGYDQCLAEDLSGNQLNEALVLWESIANSHWFSKSALIVFLNKMDVFNEKLPRAPITDYGFTDYTGPPGDAKQASKYFMAKFEALNRNPNKPVYGHFTNATDTNLLKITMGSIQDTILQQNLNQFIL